MIDVRTLTPGDRVVLRCNEARGAKERAGRFDRLLDFFGLEMAVFLLQTAPGVELNGVFMVQQDGAMKDDMHRRITVESVTSMGQG